MAKVEAKRHQLRDREFITTRSPNISDAQNLLDYREDLFTTSGYVITEPGEYSTHLEEQQNWIANFEHQSGAICIVAEYENLVIGSLDFRNRPNRRRIAHRGSFGMGIRSKWRGRGVGKVLIQELITWARRDDNPIEKIELVVLEKNQPARALYQSCGFQEEGRILKEVRLPSGEYVDGINMGLFV